MNLAYIDTNFQRLLLKCEEIAEKQELDDWRFEKVFYQNLNSFNLLTTNTLSALKTKYVLSLDEMLKKMNSMSTK